MVEGKSPTHVQSNAAEPFAAVNAEISTFGKHLDRIHNVVVSPVVLESREFLKASILQCTKEIVHLYQHVDAAGGAVAFVNSLIFAARKSAGVEYPGGESDHLKVWADAERLIDGISDRLSHVEDAEELEVPERLRDWFDYRFRIRSFDEAFVESHWEEIARAIFEWISRWGFEGDQSWNLKIESSLVDRYLKEGERKPVRSQPEKLILSQLQREILAELEGRALTADRLQTRLDVGSRDTLYGGRDRRGGLNQLMDYGLIENDRKVGGYFRPDSPPTL